MFITYAILKASGTQNLATGALSLSTAHNTRWKLTSVEVHFSASCSQVVTVTKDSIVGVNYDTVLDKQTLVTATDYVFRPTGEEIFDVGDEINLGISTAGGAPTAYATIYGIEV